MKEQTTPLLTKGIQSWETDGGASAPLPCFTKPSLTGSVAQVQWAEEIRARVEVEFDRVRESFTGIAERQGGAARADTYAIVAILEEKRKDVLTREQAGYFIHDWQEINDQVRQMLFHDERFQTIRNTWAARRQATLETIPTNGE